MRRIVAVVTVPDFESKVENGIRIEDGGAYKGVEFGELGEDGQIGITIGSYDDRFASGETALPLHESFNSLIGKKLRITVEEIP